MLTAPTRWLTVALLAALVTDACGSVSRVRFDRVVSAATVRLGTAMKGG